MKATCPRCGTKAAHEMVVSVVRTWFRCVNCSFVWRGTLLSLAFASVPLGSAFRDEDPTVPLQIPPGGSIPLHDLTPAGSRRPDPAVARARPARLQPPATEPRGEGRPASAAPPEAGSAGVLQDVQSWLDTVEQDAAPATTKSEPARRGDTTRVVRDVGSAPAPPTQPVELGAWLEEVDAALPAAESPADRERRETREESVGDHAGPLTRPSHAPGGADEFGEWMTSEELDAIPPPVAERDEPEPDAARQMAAPAPGPPDVPSQPLAASAPPEIPHKPPEDEAAASPPGLTQLDELLKQLEVVQEGLTEMEQRLEGTEPSSMKVVETSPPIADTASAEPKPDAPLKKPEAPPKQKRRTRSTRQKR